jgi:hypothetical protein
MRHFFLISLGLLELAAAGLLVYLGVQIPNHRDVEHSFQCAAGVTDHASEQVRLLRRHVEVVRRMELQQLTTRLQAQTRAVTGVMRAQTVDFEAVETIRDALGDIAGGLQGLTDTLDPAAIGKLGDGLEKVADFMDQKIIPGADKAAKAHDPSAPSADDVKRMKEVASALRQGRKGLETTLERWPELRTSLARLSAVLNSTRHQLDRAVEHRHDYETAMRQTVRVAETFVTLLPLVSEQLDDQLDEEDQTLDDLGQSLDDVSAVLPQYERMTARFFLTGRLLVWLTASIVGLHACYLLVWSRRSPV